MGFGGRAFAFLEEALVGLLDGFDLLDTGVLAGRQVSVLSVGSNSDLPLLRGNCAHLLPDLLHLVIERLLLLQVPDFVPVSLVFEVLSFLFRH